MKKTLSVAMMIMILFNVMLSYSNATELEKKTYSVKNTVQYENPITKEIEDLKLKKDNKEYNSKKTLGDGMSRAMLGSYALLDNTGKKKTLTIKLGSTDTTKDYKIYVKNAKDDTYKEVKYKLIKEDKKNKTKDIKFEVSTDEAYIKIQTNVAQMGRDVIFFAQMTKKDAKEGAKEFNSQKMKSISAKTIVE